MAGKSDTFEADLMKLIFHGTATTWLAQFMTGTTATNSLYLALHTDAGPGETGGQSTNEALYGSYTRIPVVRDGSGWTAVAGTSGSWKPSSTISFPTATSGSTTVTYVSIGVTGGTAGNNPTGTVLYFGAVSPTIAVTTGVTPQLTTSSQINED